MDVAISAWVDKGVMGLVILLLVAAVVALWNAKEKNTTCYTLTYIDLLRLQLKGGDDMTRALEALTDNLKARIEIETIRRHS